MPSRSPRAVNLTDFAALGRGAATWAGSRFERATPGEREYLRAMADVAYEQAEKGG